MNNSEITQIQFSTLSLTYNLYFVCFGEQEVISITDYQAQSILQSAKRANYDVKIEHQDATQKVYWIIGNKQ